MMSGAFSLVNVLADSIGPGTVGFNNEPQDFFMVSALQGMAMILLQTFWGIITFDALDGKKWIYLAYVWVTHLLVSCLVSTPCGKTKNVRFHVKITPFFFQTLLNQQHYYWASLVPTYVVLVVTTILAFRAAGGQFSKILACLKCSKAQTIEVPVPEEEN